RPEEHLQESPRYLVAQINAQTWPHQQFSERSQSLPDDRDRDPASKESAWLRSPAPARAFHQSFQDNRAGIVHPESDEAGADECHDRAPLDRPQTEGLANKQA